MDLSITKFSFYFSIFLFVLIRLLHLTFCCPEELVLVFPK